MTFGYVEVLKMTNKNYMFDPEESYADFDWDADIVKVTLKDGTVKLFTIVHSGSSVTFERC